MAMLPAYQIDPNPFGQSMRYAGESMRNALMAYGQMREKDNLRMGQIEALARTPGIGLAQAESLAADPALARNVLMQYSDPMLGVRKRQAEAEMSMMPLKRRQMQGQIAASAASTKHALSMSPHQLQQARISAQSAEREFNTPKPNTFDLAEGHTRYETVRNPDGTTGYRKIAEGGAKVSATAQKAIDEADDFVKQSTNALGAINEALRLNPTAYDGVAADARAAIVNNIPGIAGTRSSLATTDLNNLITNQALSALRATFGGNPTEGERKILLEVQGSTNLPTEARRVILDRAKQAAIQSLRFNQQKAQLLREGRYYQPGGQPPAAGTPMNFGPQANPALDEARSAIQRGASRDKVIERLLQNGIDPSGL